MMIENELKKYIVLNIEDLEEMRESIPQLYDGIYYLITYYNEYRILNGKHENKYIVCNQDEPYADKVWETILEGEKQKELYNKK